MRGRVHTREFMLEVCPQIITGERRAAQVCREHELVNSLLVRWRKEHEPCGDGAFLPVPKTELEAVARRIALRPPGSTPPGGGATGEQPPEEVRES